VKQAPLTVRRFKRVGYDRLVELGAFDGSTSSCSAASSWSPSRRAAR
jgi:hypothetical protein